MVKEVGMVHRTRSAWLAVCLPLVALALTSCERDVNASSSTAAPEPQRPATAPVAAAQAKAELQFVATGPLVVENQIDVASLREGVVAQIAADTGTYVRKGDALAQLDDRQISADVEASAAKVRSIAANLKNWEAETKVLLADRERAEKMWTAQLITKQDLDHAVYKQEADVYEVQREREALKNAEETLRSLELEKEKTRIVAPFDGVVARRYVHMGQRVAVGERLFWVSATAPLRVRFTVPEKMVGQIRAGEQVQVAAAELVTPEYPGKIVSVSPVVDPASGTLDVVAEVNGPSPLLRPGMQASVRLPQPK
jgi:RND family efflux transporter MFP subunit